MATPNNQPKTPTPTPGKTTAPTPGHAPKPTPAGGEKITKDRPSEVPQPATPRTGAEETKMDRKEGSPVQNTRNADRPVDRDLAVEDDAARRGATNRQHDEDEIARAQRQRDTDQDR
ncbi:MAG TPA: hypothetical protein PL070_13765 [Flavobacteriales bacterium]|nr:hypothetical protein [Flavobacteriales bacterium]